MAPADLVTGEAVELELRPARLASRLLAITIDLVVLLQAGVVVLLGTAALSSLVDDALAAAVGRVTLVSLLVGYPVATETLTRGRTLGKLALGLRVVRVDGGPVGLRQSLVRALFLVFVDGYATSGVVGLLTSLASERGRRVGDVAAGTVVVRERVPASLAGPVPMPPQLAAWAATLDLALLPDDVALAARQFLARTPQLSPAARADMGARLAAAVGRSVAPGPPAGVPDEAYLAAVLAERRRRDAGRLAARTSRRRGRTTGSQYR